MQILALEQDVPGVTPERFAPLLEAEARRVWELYQAGILRQVHFRADRAAAVLLLECADEAEAGGVLESLPLVANRLIAFELIPLKPYPGFARLFAEVSHDG